MKNQTLETIKTFVTNKLKNDFGYCGCAEGPDIATINSDDGNGREIKITITIKDEE